MTEVAAESGQRERLERTAQALRVWLDRIGRLPAILTTVLWSSVLSGLILAFLWFLRSDYAWVRWLAVPWLALAAAPQLGLWILRGSVRELFELPARLLAVKSGVAVGSSRLLERIRGEAEEAPKAGFLRTLREAYALHGEVGKIVATRAILHRFTGPIALLIGPASFIANCAIIATALLSLALLGT